MFTLHERLKADTIEITRLRLCRVILMNDSSFPWLVQCGVPAPLGPAGTKRKSERGSDSRRRS